MFYAITCFKILLFNLYIVYVSAKTLCHVIVSIKDVIKPNKSFIHSRLLVPILTNRTKYSFERYRWHMPSYNFISIDSGYCHLAAPNGYLNQGWHVIWGWALLDEIFFHLQLLIFWDVPAAGSLVWTWLLYASVYSELGYYTGEFQVLQLFYDTSNFRTKYKVRWYCLRVNVSKSGNRNNTM